MSTSYGYVCTNHDPDLYSEHWLNNDAGAEALQTLFNMERDGKWVDTPNVLFPDEPEVTPLEVGDFKSPVPVVWLREHPHCRVMLVNEHGRRYEL